MCEQAEENVKPTVPDRAKDFLLEEYKRLCIEVDHYIKESGTCVTYTIGTSGVVWAWVLTNNAGSYHGFVIWIPFLVSLIGFLRWLSLQISMSKIGAYISEIEEVFLPNRNDHPSGWETWLRPKKGAKLGKSDAGQSKRTLGAPSDDLRKNRRKIFTALGTAACIVFGLLVLTNGLAARWNHKVLEATSEAKLKPEELQSIASQVAKAILKANQQESK